MSIELVVNNNKIKESNIFWQTKRFYLCSIILIVLPGFLSFYLYPNIAVSDCDAEAYLMGSVSIKNGNGYVNLKGDPLNTWPPGFSYILSFFSNPFLAVKIINCISLSLASLLVFVICVVFNWPILLSFLITMSFSFGFLINISLNAKPDIFCYSIFMLAFLLFLNRYFYIKAIGLLFLACLVPIKLIALSFSPGLLFGYLIYSQIKFSISNIFLCLIGFVFWLFGLTSVLLFNYLTVGTLNYSHSHPGVIVNFSNEIQRFFLDFFRSGMVTWYGSIRPFPNYIFFFLCFGFCLNAIRTFKFVKFSNLAFLCGLCVFGFAWIMQLYGHYDGSSRLLGYGMFLMLFCLVPSNSFAWAGAFLAIFVSLLANHATGSRYGLNDPVYKQIATEVVQFIPPGKTINSNANNLLDVLVGVPTHFVDDPDKTVKGDLYFFVKKCEPDLLSVPVIHVNIENDKWSVLKDTPKWSLLLKP